MEEDGDDEEAEEVVKITWADFKQGSSPLKGLTEVSVFSEINNFVPILFYFRFVRVSCQFGE